MSHRRMDVHIARVLICLMIVCGLPTEPAAYGSATHIGEAEAYLENIRVQPLAGPRGDYALLCAPDNLEHLKLGSIWPDLMRVWPDVEFEPHDHGLGLWLLQRAELQPEEWKLALAVGNLNHMCGDLVAQDLATQYYGTKGRWADLDIIEGVMDDRAGGEKEGLFEISLEILRADLNEYIELGRYFLSDLREPDPWLLRVIEWYLSEAAQYYDLEYDRSQAAEALSYIEPALRAASDPAEWGRALDPDAPLAARLLDGSRALLGPDDGGLEGLSIHWEELARVLNGPLAEEWFYDDYYTLFQPLSVTALRGIGGAGDLWQDWPNWDAKLNIAGSVSALLALRPGIYADQAAVMVADARWYDADTKQPISSIDAHDPPAAVRVWVRVFATTAVDDLFILRVRQDRPGFDYEDDPLIAQQQIELRLDPQDYGTRELPEFELTFDPRPYIENARGFTLELALTCCSQRALFTSSFDQLLAITATDVFTPNYRNKWDSYGKHWPDGLAIVNPQFSIDYGDLSGRVLDAISGLGINEATVSIDDGALEALTNLRGRYAIDEVPAGAHAIQAQAEGYGAGSIEVELSAGGWVDQDILVAPMPEVDDGGPYTPLNRQFTVRWDADLGPGLQRFEVGLGSRPGEIDLSGWQDAGLELEAVIDLAEPVDDGTRCYGAVRPMIEGLETQAGQGDGILVDASAPELSDLRELSDPSRGWVRRARLAWSAQDEHSGIADRWVSVGSRPLADDLAGWLPLERDSFELVPAEYSPRGPIFVNVQVVNAAGLAASAALELQNDEQQDPADDDSADEDELSACGC